MQTFNFLLAELRPPLQTVFVNEQTDLGEWQCDAAGGVG